eukprot:CAMPEP_0118931794 /NCGR_PEP_ID=MMETSP1169-20130426/8009_1 /TAXON_ID=36882 /ORGANISM="Pyramimonas obovata, Strain CCMP722" /LENGTH=97 /DNA_ID=CAMNT_0006874335 /DNA_START=93 /DNA_END=383 /DNA_ORIENTATION=+
MSESLLFREKKRPRREGLDVNSVHTDIAHGAVMNGLGSNRRNRLGELAMPKLTERQQLALALQESLAACGPQLSRRKPKAKRPSGGSRSDTSGSDDG